MASFFLLPLTGEDQESDDYWVYLTGWALYGLLWLIIFVVAIWQIFGQVDYNFGQVRTLSQRFHGEYFEFLVIFRALNSTISFIFAETVEQSEAYQELGAGRPYLPTWLGAMERVIQRDRRTRFHTQKARDEGLYSFYQI